MITKAIVRVISESDVNGQALRLEGSVGFGQSFLVRIEANGYMQIYQLDSPIVPPPPEEQQHLLLGEFLVDE